MAGFASADIRRIKKRQAYFSTSAVCLCSLIVLSIVLISSLDLVEAGRRGGGGSWGRGSSRKSGSSSGSWFGGSKKKTTYNRNPQSSYPKQEYKPKNTGIGGGGFVAPGGKTSYGGTGGGYGKNYGQTYYGSKPTFSSSYGRYGGGTNIFGQTRSSSLYGGGGSRAFGLGAGAGFSGEAMGGVAAMETYHRYKQYQAMSYYGMHGGHYGGYGAYGSYGGYGLYYNRPYSCFGGCPIGAFCDYGMCRCRGGYEARYGSCWNDAGAFQGRSWSNRLSPNFNPFVSCNEHKQCMNIDMNSICSTKTQKCECREDMRWNNETLECQVYMDVDCSEFENPEASTPPTTYTFPKDIFELLERERLEKAKDSQEISTGSSLDVNNVTLPTYNLTETDSGELQLDLENLSPADTLAGSKLLEIDVKEASQEEIKEEFCREIKAVSLKYSEPQRNPTRYTNTHYPSRGRTIGSGTLVVIIVISCCACFA